MNNAMHSVLTNADNESLCTRRHFWMADDSGRAIDLVVFRLSAHGIRVTKGVEVSGFSVVWNVRTGGFTGGWRKPWKAHFRTEAEALSFADGKWPVLAAWLAEAVAA